MAGPSTVLMACSTSDEKLPYDQARVRVIPCVTATQKCRGARLANPSDYAVEVNLSAQGQVGPRHRADREWQIQGCASVVRNAGLAGGHV